MVTIQTLRGGVVDNTDEGGGGRLADITVDGASSVDNTDVGGYPTWTLQTTK